jgi:prepilin-type N-terminal cleavage/methylation domain-containing protein
MNAGRTNAHDRAGLNMIELLVAMVVLSLVVTMMAAIFRHSESAWTQGTGDNEVETAGRVALSLLTRDLQGAVADSNLTFDIEEDYGLTNCEVCFIALQGSPTSTSRATRAIMYWVTNSELIRAAQPVDINTMNCYTNKDWFINYPTPLTLTAVVARNVSRFRLATNDYYSAATANSNRLPQYVDICLDVLSERDALQAAKLKAKRFTTRVYFPNRNGYDTR